MGIKGIRYKISTFLNVDSICLFYDGDNVTNWTVWIHFHTLTIQYGTNPSFHFSYILFQHIIIYPFYNLSKFFFSNYWKSRSTPHILGKRFVFSASSTASLYWKPFLLNVDNIELHYVSIIRYIMILILWNVVYYESC